MVAANAISIAITTRRFSWKWALRPLLLGPLGTALTVYEIASFMLDARIEVATKRFFDGFNTALRGYAGGFSSRTPLEVQNVRIAPATAGVIRTANFGYQGRAYEVGVIAATDASGKTQGHIIIADTGSNRMLDPEDLPIELRELLKEMARASLLVYP